jgi:putative hemolysin
LHARQGSALLSHFSAANLNLVDGNAEASNEPYQVRLATPDELPELFSLRFDIFYTELGATHGDDDGAFDTAGLDVDEHDALCDHLVILQGQRLVGTYRLLPLERLSRKTSNSASPLAPYSHGEFDLTALRAHYGDQEILELGRSCIHRDHRNGQTARMLWAGLAKYMTEGGFKALIGCVSVHGISSLQAYRMAKAFRTRGISDGRFDLPVQTAYLDDFDPNNPELEDIAVMPQDVSKLMPPLMRGYVNLGAKVCGGPAWDRSFNCHDFLMLLDTGSMAPRQLRALLTLSGNKSFG